nr:nucleotide-binding alpha-beta plait domain-containing protein [Tanacetum cinerariifolium]
MMTTMGIIGGVYALKSRKHVMAVEKLRHASLFSSYRHPPVGGVGDEHQQFFSMNIYLNGNLFDQSRLRNTLWNNSIVNKRWWELDDLILHSYDELLLKWSRLNAKNLIFILKCFEEASDFKANLSISKLYEVGVSIKEVEAVASSICCIHDFILFTYLGLSVGRNMHLSEGWGEVINRLRNWLFAWKARSLSIEGRLTLIKFVLGICNGKSTCFWLDLWSGNDAQLRDLFPMLYDLDSCQDCKVCDRLFVTTSVWGGSWSWRFPPRGRALDDLEALVSHIGNLSLSIDEDKWSSSRDASGSFKVKTCCNIIQDNTFADCSLGLHHYGII